MPTNKPKPNDLDVYRQFLADVEAGKAAKKISANDAASIARVIMRFNPGGIRQKITVTARPATRAEIKKFRME